MNTNTSILSIGLLLGAMLLLPGASADHGYGPEPQYATAAICHTDIWAGNAHIAPKCRELWGCLGNAEPTSKEYTVKNTHYTVYYCPPGPATGPPIWSSPELAPVQNAIAIACDRVAGSDDCTGTDAPPKCNGFWYYEETFGPVTIWTDGSRSCTGASIDRLDDLTQTNDAPDCNGIYYEEFNVGPVKAWIGGPGLHCSGVSVGR